MPSCVDYREVSGWIKRSKRVDYRKWVGGIQEVSEWNTGSHSKDGEYTEVSG